VRAVRADDEVELAHGAVGEGDPPVVQPRHPGAEQVLDVRGGVQQHLCQVAAQDLQLADDPVPAQVRHGHLGEVSPGRVDVGDALLVQAPLAHGVHQPHPFDDRPARPAQVDGLSARPRRRRALDDGHVESVSVHPEGRRGPRDAGAGDQNAACHGVPPIR
jgi:hypothetical protein